MTLVSVLLIVIQQLLIVFALALLAVTCAKRPTLRCAIVVLLLCNPVSLRRGAVCFFRSSWIDSVNLPYRRRGGTFATRTSQSKLSARAWSLSLFRHHDAPCRHDLHSADALTFLLATIARLKNQMPGESILESS